MSWTKLLHKADALLRALPSRGIPVPTATLGGGVALMLAFGHRRSRDIDLFLSDPQLLPALSPRLNDAAAALTEDYEEAANHLRLALDEGEVDFIVAPHLTDGAAAPVVVEGLSVQVESALEVLAKKLLYRGTDMKLRDLFDLACALRLRPELGTALAPLATRQREALLRRVAALEPTFTERARHSLDLMPAGERFVDDAPAIVREWLEHLPSA